MAGRRAVGSWCRKRAFKSFDLGGGRERVNFILEGKRNERARQAKDHVHVKDIWFVNMKDSLSLSLPLFKWSFMYFYSLISG